MCQTPHPIRVHVYRLEEEKAKYDLAFMYGTPYTFRMQNPTPPRRVDRYIRDKRDELIWALSHQDYSLGQIGDMFNMKKVSVQRVLTRKPRGWTPKWVKIV